MIGAIATGYGEAFRYSSAESVQLLAPAPGEDIHSRTLELSGSGQTPENRFRELVRQWKAERGPTSSVTKLARHPAYREIVNLGEAAVPLLLAELERQPDHWFLALYEITGVDPVPRESRGRLKEMASAWLRWGREHGIVW